MVKVDALAATLRDALTGPDHIGARTIVWSDRGSQLVLELDSLQVRTVEDVVVISIDTESIEFGVAPLIVRFSMARAGDDASLVATTDETALGHPVVAATWGRLFRDVVWSALVRLHIARSEVAGMRPHTISVGDGHLLMEHIRDVVEDESARQ